jgi:hypothetical protein
LPETAVIIGPAEIVDMEWIAKWLSKVTDSNGPVASLCPLFGGSFQGFYGGHHGHAVLRSVAHEGHHE